MSLGTIAAFLVFLVLAGLVTSLVLAVSLPHERIVPHVVEKVVQKTVLVSDGCFTWSEVSPVPEIPPTEEKTTLEGHETAEVGGEGETEGLSFGPWSDVEGFPLFRDYQLPPHWTGAPDPTSGAQHWVLPGRYGLGSYEMKRFVEDWTIIDTVMERYPSGPWPQLLGMSADRVARAVRAKCLATGLEEVDVCIIEDKKETRRSECPVHTRCVAIHSSEGRVSRIPLSTY